MAPTTTRQHIGTYSYNQNPKFLLPVKRTVGYHECPIKIGWTTWICSQCAALLPQSGLASDDLPGKCRPQWRQRVWWFGLCGSWETVNVGFHNQNSNCLRTGPEGTDVSFTVLKLTTTVCRLYLTTPQMEKGSLPL